MEGNVSITVKIPTPLRNSVGGASQVTAAGNTVAELIANLDGQYPGIKDRLCGPDGECRRFVNIYVDGEDIRFSDGLATEVAANSEVSIVPAVAGG